VTIIYVDLEKKENGDGTSWADALNELPTNVTELVRQGHKVWVANYCYNSEKNGGDAE
jgi:hypothetical protein